MHTSSLRIGSAACMLGLCTGAALATEPREPQTVQSRVFEVDYHVSDEALPLDAVELWYTVDEGRTWQRYGLDHDRQPPMTFHAPQEGLVGLYFVLRNTTGESGPTPSANAAPQFSVFVDYTPPVVQVHVPTQSSVLGRPVLQIRWTAIDARLGPRPVRLDYATPPDATWTPVSPDPLANTGRYDWRFPERFVGPVRIRVTVEDLGGHKVQAESEVVEIHPPAPPIGTVSPTAPTAQNSQAVSEPARLRAAELMAEALRRRDEGDYAGGVSLLRESVRLNPYDATAFAEMASLLYRMGEEDRAMEAYEISLQQDPTLRAALYGAAVIERQRRDFDKAASRLRTILDHNPGDTEIWMYLGDVALFKGDEVSAREYYLEAATRDLTNQRIVEEARQRLQIMNDVSRGRIMAPGTEAMKSQQSREAKAANGG